MIKQKPRIRIADIFAVFCVFIGLLFFLIAIHILAINTTGGTQTILNSTFTIFLRIYVTLLIFAGVGIVVQLLRLLTWYVVTPKWLKQRMSNGKP